MIDGKEQAKPHLLRHRQRLLGNNSRFAPNHHLQEQTTVKRGQDAKLWCNSSHVPLRISYKHLKWFRNGVEVETHYRYKKNEENGQLVISNIQLEDEGIWHCETAHGVLNIVSLSVLDEPKLPYLLIDGRILDPGNLFIPIKENSKLSVQCIAEGGNPAPKLHWILVSATGIKNMELVDGGTIIPGLRELNGTSSIITAVSLSTRSEAELSPVLRIHHNSTILCTVHHQTLDTPRNASLLLDVQYEPSFGISRIPGFGYPVIEGIPLSLKCDVDSNPPSSPIWLKDNGPPPVEQSSDGFLNFSSVSMKDSGWYKCITKYLSVEYSSIGYFLNVREAGNQAIQDATALAEEPIEEGSAVEVTLGGQIQLECPAGSVSCWGRSKYPGQHLEPLGPGPKLTLGNVVYQESGEYKCFVGKSSKMEKWKSRSVRVNVVGSPVIYPGNKTITAVTNQRVTFSLEFCANPPVTKVFWIRGLKSLPPGTTIDDMIAHNISESSAQYCHVAELTISSVQIENAGDYLFVAISNKGIAGATITLNVTVSKSLVDLERKNKSYSSVLFSILNSNTHFVYLLLFHKLMVTVTCR